MNMTKRGKHLILFLNISTISCMVTSVKIDCAKPVQRCPLDKKDWIFKKDEMKCAHDEGYVCIRNVEGRLFESCMVNYTIQANSGNCPVVIACNRNKPHLGSVESYFVCPPEIPGCPPEKHEQYSIYQIVRYPKCIESSSQVDIENTSIKPSLMNRTTTLKTNESVNQKETYLVPFIVVTIIFITTVLIVITLSRVKWKEKIMIFRYRKENKDDTRLYGMDKYGTAVDPDVFNEAGSLQSLVSIEPSKQEVPVTILKADDKCKSLRDWILSFNAEKFSRVQILPLKEDDTVEVDKIYVPVLISNEYDKGTNRFLDEEKNTNIPLEQVLMVHQDEGLHYVFMLGEAGYGKTVQCQQITHAWCKAWRKENTSQITDGLEKSLKEFDFLFFVKLREVQPDRTSVIDMIHDTYYKYQSKERCIDDIQSTLENGHFRSLILLDGLDQWNVSEEKKKELMQTGIPNFGSMKNCTILFTLRSSKLIEIKNFCLQEADSVVRIHGFDESGILDFTTRMLRSYFRIERFSKMFHDKYKLIDETVTRSSYAVKLLMKIPLLAVFCIFTCYEDFETGYTLTTFYLAILETLIQRSFNKKRSGYKCSYTPMIDDYWYVRRYMHRLSRLGEVAFNGLSSKTDALIFKSKELNDTLGKESLDFFLKIGLLSKIHASGKRHQDSIEIIFLHKTLQEFCAALYLWKEDKEREKFLKNQVSDIRKALDFSVVLTFLCGLSPSFGSILSQHIKTLASTDKDILDFRSYFSSESYEKVFYLYAMQVRCYREVRKLMSIERFCDESKFRFVFSDIILHGRDMDKQVIRETADILRFHTDEIESLQMKYIADDEEDGISNEVLRDFFDRSVSIKSFNIDGYVRGQCRLFKVLGKKMSSLCTLGLHNVAFTGDILRDLFQKDETKNNIKALGLFNIKTADDLLVDYEYQFSSYYRTQNTFSPRSGNEPMRTISVRSFHSCSDDGDHHYSNESNEETQNTINMEPQSGTLVTFSNEEDVRGLNMITESPLSTILSTLPFFKVISTLHVSYMHFSDDRKMLLDVLTRIKTLKHVGYQGSAACLNRNENYDVNVITQIMDLTNLTVVFLSDLDLNEEVLNIEKLSELVEMKLQDIKMNSAVWNTFVHSVRNLPNIKNLKRILLTDTNVNKQIIIDLKGLSPSLEIATYESSAW